MTPAELFARLQNPPIDAYLNSGIGRIKGAAERHWPSDDHEENIWTTNTSVGQFETFGAGDERTLINEAEYSGYTDDGFTFRGKATARPWAQRGGAPYLEQVADAQVESEAQALLDLVVEGITRG